MMKKNLRKMLSYFKPYLGFFMADMFFALGAAAVSLIVPLVVRFEGTNKDEAKEILQHSKS